MGILSHSMISQYFSHFPKDSVHSYSLIRNHALGPGVKKWTIARDSWPLLSEKHKEEETLLIIGAKYLLICNMWIISSLISRLSKKDTEESSIKSLIDSECA